MQFSFGKNYLSILHTVVKLFRIELRIYSALNKIGSIVVNARTTVKRVRAYYFVQHDHSIIALHAYERI